MISRIVIENFKTIESMTLELGRVTVIIGANGSGKSNIIEAVTLCSAASANQLNHESLYARGIRMPDDPYHIFTAFDNIDNRGLSFRVYMRGSETALFDAKISISSGGAYGVPYFFHQDINPIIDAVFKLINLKYITQNDSQMRDENDDDRARKASDLVISVEDGFRANGISTFMAYCPEYSSLRSFLDEGQIKPIGVRGEGLFRLLTTFMHEENRDRLHDIKSALQLLDWFDDFDLVDSTDLLERTLNIKDHYLTDERALFTQRSANEGFLFLLFYVSLIVSKDTPKFFAIDNIDTSLNPKLCAELMRHLTELAVKYDKQVILTTHNPAILDGLNLHDDDQRLYVTERKRDGRTRIRRVEAPRPPEKHEELVPLSEAFLRGYIGGLPNNF